MESHLAQHHNSSLASNINCFCSQILLMEMNTGSYTVEGVSLLLAMSSQRAIVSLKKMQTPSIPLNSEWSWALGIWDFNQARHHTLKKEKASH